MDQKRNNNGVFNYVQLSLTIYLKGEDFPFHFTD